MNLYNLWSWQFLIRSNDKKTKLPKPRRWVFFPFCCSVAIPVLRPYAKQDAPVSTHNYYYAHYSFLVSFVIKRNFVFSIWIILIPQGFGLRKILMIVYFLLSALITLYLIIQVMTCSPKGRLFGQMGYTHKSEGKLSDLKDVYDDQEDGDYW